MNKKKKLRNTRKKKISFTLHHYKAHGRGLLYNAMAVMSPFAIALELVDTNHSTMLWSLHHRPPSIVRRHLSPSTSIRHHPSPSVIVHHNSINVIVHCHPSQFHPTFINFHLTFINNYLSGSIHLATSIH
jgi:hypothetical protein